MVCASILPEEAGRIARRRRGSSASMPVFRRTPLHPNPNPSIAPTLLNQGERLVRIGYSSLDDPMNVDRASGVPYNQVLSLRKQGHAVSLLGPLLPPPSFLERARRAVNHRMAARMFLDELTPRVARQAAALLRRNLDRCDAEVILSAGAVPFGYFEPDRPYVVDCDASFASIVKKYTGYSDLNPRLAERHDAAEGRALRRAAFCVFASPWAATEAIQYYDLDPGSVRVVPHGAGMPGLRPAAVRAAIAARDLTAPRLVMIGVDWERKGGPRVLDVVRSLRRSGLEASLTIVGARVPSDVEDLPFVTVTGYLSKQRPDDLRILEAILADSAYLLLLSRAEAFGIAAAEANAYALPCAVSDLDGLRYVVRDDLTNGRRFTLWDSPDRIAEEIGQDLTDPSRYERLALGAFAEFERSLNWEAVGRLHSRILTAAAAKTTPSC